MSEKKKAKSRKPISKKIRFEVFKRDGFQCQYCGEKAPDVILHVDHIKPVAGGGENHIMNLITACQGCNLGKGARPLESSAELDKQRAQLDELNERRIQIEMMMEWRDALKGFGDEVLERAADYWGDAVSGYTLNEVGRKKLKAHIKKFGIEAVLDGIDIATDTYLRFDGDEATKGSVEEAFNKLGGVLYYKRNPEKRRHSRNAYYVRGILRNRLDYVNEAQVMQILSDAEANNCDPESPKSFACEVKNWTQFRDGMASFMATYGDSQ